jgi:hypothetical protein
LEEGVIAGGDVPSFSRNGDKLPVGIGEIEENFAGDGIRAASTHATPHGEALVVTGLVGLGFEVIEDRVEGVRSGDGVIFGEKPGEEPVAKGRRADRKDVEPAGGWFVQADEGLAVTGREEDAAAGDAEKMRQRRSWTHEIPPFSVWQWDLAQKGCGSGKLLKETEMFCRF